MPVTTIYLGPLLPATSCGLPGARTGGTPCSCLTLLRVGFTEPPQSPAVLVVSYTTVSPLPAAKRHRRSVLCGTIRRVAPPGCYPALFPVESGLSSRNPKEPRGRPADSQVKGTQDRGDGNGRGTSGHQRPASGQNRLPRVGGLRWWRSTRPRRPSTGRLPWFQ